MTRPKAVSICLLLVVLSLLAVGAISGTFLRHTIQVTAAAAALALLFRGFPWAPYAALPTFMFWLSIVALIWLYLLGISEMASGTYTAEMVLTAIIAAASICGAILAIRSGRGSRPARVTALLLFLALQIGAMWLSFRPAIQTT